MNTTNFNEEDAVNAVARKRQSINAGISVMNAALPAQPLGGAREELKTPEKRSQRKRTRNDSYVPTQPKPEKSMAQRREESSKTNVSGLSPIIKNQDPELKRAQTDTTHVNKMASVAPPMVMKR